MLLNADLNGVHLATKTIKNKKSMIMKIQPKISIIIPIYNVEKFLCRCIDSVLNQTLKDIEIILATDGPDACDKICHEYAKKDKRVKILSHPGSYGKAFNKSMKIAQGKYIGIVEADDWCASTMFEKMYNLAEKENADVVKCGFYFAFDDQSKNYTVLHNQYNENLDIFNQSEFISSQPSVWSCIYKKDFLIQNDIEMINDRMSFIDVPFHYETICKASKYILLKEPLYYYYQGNPNQSVQNVKPLDGLKSEIHAISLIYKKNGLFDRLKEGLIYSITLHLLWNYSRLNPKDKDLFLKYASRFVKTLDISNLNYTYFNKDQKSFLLFVTEHKPYIYKTRQIMKKLFSIDNEDIYKRITIFGKKIKIKSKKRMIASLQYNIKTQDFLLNQKQKEVSEKTETIKQQQQTIAQKENKIKAIEQELLKKDSIINDQNKLIEANKKTLTDLNKDIEQKKNQIQEKVNEAKNDQKTINALNDSIKYKNTILEDLKEKIRKHIFSLENKDAILNKLNEDLKEKNEQIEHKQEKLDEQSRLLKALTTDLEQKNYFLNKQTKDILEKEDTITKITNEKRSIQTEKENLDKQINDLEHQKNQLILVNEDYKKAKDFISCFAEVLDSKVSDDILPQPKDQNIDENKQLYSDEFYKINAKESFESAKKIINILIKYYAPKSVLDIGCGVGTWLKAWKEASATKVLGIDTNEMPENALYIPRKNIKVFDFEVDKLDIEDKFDLAMSLECFEHITKKHEDNAFNTLVNSADIILFSAGIPFQVGTNHINCHKLAYWVDKFKQKGYKCYDIIRPECIKQSLNVGSWYMQNILVFAKNDKASIIEANGAVSIANPVMFYHNEILKDILVVNNN